MSMNRSPAAFCLIFSALGVMPIIGPEILPLPTTASAGTCGPTGQGLQNKGVAGT
jgi:hypothetical protein